MQKCVFVCTNGAEQGICHPKGADFLPNMTVLFTFYAPKSTIAVARSNYSIVSVMDTSELILIQDLVTSEYRDALRWPLNYAAMHIPPPSSIVEAFWTSSYQLRTRSTAGILTQNFLGVLIIQFWSFNSNNWGNIDTRQNQTNTNLPLEFSTRAFLVEPYDKVQFDPGMCILFIVLQGMTMTFTWSVLIWLWFCGNRATKDIRVLLI
jgi:hypothetical protein